ncbi:hypothetical protein CC78DRAFT_103849 [Lojkania enalia]|uniref:Uncharacterized protein n=1 Tax=Lojkania enalia TaxID=147567 RepID=A0A9P4KFM8_9PLEO|nr:hypothetical protein CC78DRAFT_103849 [Didymosphaeria enalia]
MQLRFQWAGNIDCGNGIIVAPSSHCGRPAISLRRRRSCCCCCCCCCCCRHRSIAAVSLVFSTPRPTESRDTNGIAAGGRARNFRRRKAAILEAPGCVPRQRLPRPKQLQTSALTLPLTACQTSRLLKKRPRTSRGRSRGWRRSQCAVWSFRNRPPSHPAPSAPY